jgi:hypothetical protein
VGLGVQGRRGKILGLRRLVDEYEEPIRADFLGYGRSLDELGVTLSYFDLLAWLRHPPARYSYGRLRAQEAAAQAAKEAEDAAEAAKPEDERVIGRNSALPADELMEFIGWGKGAIPWQ